MLDFLQGIVDDKECLNDFDLAQKYISLDESQKKISGIRKRGRQIAPANLRPDEFRKQPEINGAKSYIDYAWKLLMVEQKE